MRETIVVTGGVPPFVQRSIKSMANTVLRDYALLLDDHVTERKEAILDGALSGQVTSETWCLLYIAYRVAEKSRLKTETITPLREALLEYIRRNKDSDNKPFVSFLAEREIILRARNVHLTDRRLHDPSWHIDRYSVNRRIDNGE
jgi:hypothetical protein